MMDLNLWYAYVKVVQSGSFTRASQTLGIPKATLSREIKVLEEKLETPLIHRNTRSLHVTEVGQLYFNRWSRVIQEVEAIELESLRLKKAPEGKIRINAPVEIGKSFLSPIIDEFLKTYQKTSVELHLSRKPIDLVKEGFDVAFVGGHLSDSSLISRKIAHLKLNLVASPDYLKTHGEPTQIQHLKNHSCICLGGTDQPSLWNLTQGTKRVQVRLKGRVEVNLVDIILEMALAGHGIAFLPSNLYKKAVEEKRLRLVLPQWSSGDIPISIVTPQHAYVAPKVKAFIQFVIERKDRIPLVCQEVMDV
jgi:DNA-binding transcriptional LysR family regulator